jgi:hypothetical protein
MSVSSLRLLLLPALGAALLLLAACEESVDPLLRTNRYYSMYGFLNMNRDTQYVRVDEIRETLQLTRREPLNGRVTSRDLMTGEVIAWRDSIFTYGDGTIAHVFWAPLRVIPTHRYRIEVVRADGAVSSVETTIPPQPVAVVHPPETRVIGQQITVLQTVVWQNVVMAPDSTATWYRMFAGAGRPFTDIALRPLRTEMTEAGWETRINLSADRDSLIEKAGGLGILLGMGMNIIVRDSTWDPPGDRFDPRVLSQPGVFSNVENGFGFVGAAGTFGVEWVIDPTVANQLGFPLPGKR